MSYKIITFTLVVSFCLSNSTVFALSNSELQQKKNQVNSELQQKQNNQNSLQDQMNSILDEISNTETQLQTISNSIQEKENQIGELKTQIALEENEIAQLQLILNTKEKDLQLKKEEVAHELNIMYSKGNVSFIEYLLRSDDISDFLDRYKRLNEILSNIHDMYKKIKKDVDDLNIQKKIIEDKKMVLETQKETVQIAEADLVNQQTSQQNLLNQLKTQKTSLAVQVSQNQEIMNQLIRETNEIDAQMNAQAPSDSQTLPNNTPVIVGNGIVDIAYKWVKLRGLGSPNPVIYSMPNRQADLRTYGDCSIFTRRVLLDAGYGDIGWNTAEQVSNPKGQFIENLSDIQPGDLIYFGPSGSHRLYSTLPDGRKITTAHVAIYVGNYKMIDLSESVGTISVKDFSSNGSWHWYVVNRFVGAKRFTK